MKLSRELKIGFVFVAALALFIWGYNYLKGKDIFKRENRFYSVYASVSGLSVSSPVYISGLKVGLVKDISFLEGRLDRVLVSFDITPGLSIPSDTRVWIYSADLMGSKALDLRLGASAVFARPGDTLPGEVQASLQEEVNRQVLPLKTKAEALMGSIDSAMMVIRYVFNEKTRENLEKSFASIKATIENLESTSYNIDTLVSTQRGRLAGILGNIESISANLKANNQQISNLITNFSSLSDTLARIQITRTVEDLNTVLGRTSAILLKVEKGEGSLGLLVNNDSLYRQMESASHNLDLLLEDLRLHPNRYVQFSLFGRNSKKNPYQAPKK